MCLLLRFCLSNGYGNGICTIRMVQNSSYILACLPGGRWIYMVEGDDFKNLVADKNGLQFTYVECMYSCMYG